MIANPVINSPFEEPSRHFELTEDGTPTGVILPNRRRSEHLVPVPAPRRRRRAGDQGELGLEGRDTADFEVTPNHLVNEIRRHVGAWRKLPPQQWGVTPETARLPTTFIRRKDTLVTGAMIRLLDLVREPPGGAAAAE